MVKIKAIEYKPEVNEFYINCRECGEAIKCKAVDLTHEEVKIFHAKCYTQFLLNYKEYGIRIGMRVHGKKNKKRLPPADRTLSGDDTFE